MSGLFVVIVKVILVKFFVLIWDVVEIKNVCIDEIFLFFLGFLFIILNILIK